MTTLRGGRVRVALLVSAVAVVVVAGLALSSGGDRVVPGATVAQAAGATAGAAGAKVALTMTMQVPGVARPVSATGGGYEVFKRRNGRLSFRFSSLGAVPASQATFDVLYAYPTFFMRSPLFARSLPAGKTWLKLDVGGALRQQGIDISALPSSQSDPSQYLDFLRATRGRVQKLGTDVVRGVATTHYKAVADLSHYPQLLAPAKRPAASRAVSQLIKLTGTRELPTEVWIDAHHMIRRLRLQTAFKQLAGPLAGKRLSMNETIEFFDFGPKPLIKPPPASQTYDETTLAASALKQQAAKPPKNPPPVGAATRRTRSLRGSNFVTSIPSTWTSRHLPGKGDDVYFFGSGKGAVSDLGIPAPGQIGLTIGTQPASQQGNPRSPAAALKRAVGTPRAATGVRAIQPLSKATLGTAPAATIEFAYSLNGVPNVQSDLVALHHGTVTLIEINSGPQLAAQAQATGRGVISHWHWTH